MRLTLIICLVIAGVTCSCQFSEKKLPKKVIESFQSRFPKAEKVKWEKDKKLYEAEFTLEGTEVSALYDKKGHLLEIETEISLNQLPPSVLNSITKEFSDFKITESEKIESKQLILYEVEIKKGEQKKEIYFNPQGKILKIKDED